MPTSADYQPTTYSYIDTYGVFDIDEKWGAGIKDLRRVNIAEITNR